MRICYVLLSPTFGMHQYTADLANRMGQAGHEVHLMTTTHAPRDRYGPDVEIHTPVETTSTGLSWEVIRVHAFRRALQAIRRVNPNVIHFTGPHLWNVLLIQALQAQSIPICHTIHDLHPHVGAFYGRFLYLWNRSVRNSANQLLVHGERYRDEVLAQGIAPSRVTYTPLMHLFLSYEQDRRLLQSPATIQYEPWALFFARLEVYKGLPTLIEAARRIGPTTQSSPRVILAGRGRLQKLDMGLIPPSVEVRNRLIGDQEAIDLFSRCGLVVLPYIEASQSALIAAAYCFRKPVIVTRTGALPEYVVPGETGWVIPPNDPQALTDRLEEALEDPDRLMQMGRAGREWYECQRQVEEENLQKMYAELADKGHVSDSGIYEQILYTFEWQSGGLNSLSSILFLTQILPYPLDSGAKIRQYHMLRHLVRNHQVTLVSFTRPDDKPEAIEHLRSICHAVYPVQMRRSPWRNVRAAAKGMLSGLPMVVARDEVAEMGSTLRQLIAEQAFDVIHADQLSMAWWGRLAAQVAGPHHPRTLLDEHNAIYLLTQRMADTEGNPVRRAIMAREARAFARYEAAMCQEFDAVLTVTEEDREHLLALFLPDEREWLAGKFTVVPICVDPQQASTIAHRDGEAPTILHLGTMFWPPNVHGVLWFAREVLPLIHRQVPDARFIVVGKDPPPEVQALAANPRVQVTGYIADPMPYLEVADVFVVPLHAGGGMRVKIVDAWLWGMPTVSTSIGAEGIAYRDGENILVANDAPAFAQATIRLLADSVLNEQLRNNGRIWVETHYDWQVVYRQVDEVYAQVLGIEESRD